MPLRDKTYLHIQREGNEIKFFYSYEPEHAFGDFEIRAINDYINKYLPFSAPMRDHDYSDLRDWLNQHSTQRWTFSHATVWFESDIDGTHFRLRWN